MLFSAIFFCHYRIFLTLTDRPISRNGVKAVRRRGSVATRSVKNKMSCTSTIQILELRSFTKTPIFDLFSPLSLPYQQSQFCQIPLTRDSAWWSPSPPSCLSVCVSVGVLIGHNDVGALLHSVCLSLLDGRRDR